MKQSAILCAAVLLFAGCKKEDPIEISATPEIEFVSISPGTATAYKDEVVITIKYKDGDGDLGENSANVKNLFVTDDRNGVVFSYRIQQLGPDGETMPIQGNLPIVLKNTAITNGSSSQTATFSVYLRDRAGNTSNTVQSTAITVAQ